MIEKQELFRWAEAHKDEQLALLKELAVIPAPSHHEEKRAEFIKNWLEKNGAQGVLVDDALNVLLPISGKQESAWSVFSAHTDVVFPDTEPLPVRQDGQFLYGPGIGDDTANVVALMLMAKYMLETERVPETPVLFAFNSCEEGLGNLKGIRQICKDWQVKEHVTFDGNLDEVVCRAVGSERWKVTAKTIGGHSFGAFGNPNAIAALAAMITELYQQPVPVVPERKTTFNVGTISGGTSVNTIAQNAEMLYEYRSDDVKSLAQMRQQFSDVFDKLNCEETRFEKELVGERPCSILDDSPALEKLLNRCASANTEITGKTVRRRPSSTDCNIPLSLGIPSTCIGLYYGAKSHTREEYLVTDSLLPGLKLCMLLIARTCM